MKRTKYVVIALNLLILASCKAQSTQGFKEKSETWYTYTMDGELQSCAIYKDKMIFNSLLGSDDNKGISKVFIEKVLDSVHYLIRNDKKSPPYAVISLITSEDVLKMTPVLTGASIAEVEKSFDEGLIKDWALLTGQDWYTKEKVDKLEQAPGLDELKREDLLISMQWRKPLSNMLQQYLKDTDGKRPFMVYRFVEKYRNQKLVELGYNPYKRVVYNLFKKFEEDEEIMKLLNEEIKF